MLYVALQENMQQIVFKLSHIHKTVTVCTKQYKNHKQMEQGIQYSVISIYQVCRGFGRQLIMSTMEVFL